MKYICAKTKRTVLVPQVTPAHNFSVVLGAFIRYPKKALAPVIWNPYFLKVIISFFLSSPKSIGTSISKSDFLTVCAQLLGHPGSSKRTSTSPTTEYYSLWINLNLCPSLPMAALWRECFRGTAVSCCCQGVYLNLINALHTTLQMKGEPSMPGLEPFRVSVAVKTSPLLLFETCGLFSGTCYPSGSLPSRVTPSPTWLTTGINLGCSLPL